MKKITRLTNANGEFSLGRKNGLKLRKIVEISHSKDIAPMLDRLYPAIRQLVIASNVITW